MTWLKNLWARFVQFMDDLRDDSKLKRKHDALAQASLEKRDRESMEQYRNRLLNQSEQLMNLGQYDPALVLMNRAVECFPEYAPAWYKRAVVLHRQEKYDESMVDCDKVLSLSPGDAHADNLCGANWYFGHKDPERALIDYQLALLHNHPRPEMVYANMSMAYRMQGKFEQALAACNTSIRGNPASAASFNNRALVYFAMGNLDAAFVDINRAIQLDADHIAHCNNRAIFYASIGAYETAFHDLDDAEQRDPLRMSVHTTRATIYLLMGEISAAQDTIERACDLFPDIPEVWGDRAIIEYESGDKAEAREWWDKFVAARPRYKLPEYAAHFCSNLLPVTAIMHAMQKEFA